MWRPSRRTALEAHVGRRYGSTTYYGSFAWAPNARSSVNVSVYDNITGFGGAADQRARRPADRVRRDPQSDHRRPQRLRRRRCEGGSCLAGALGSVRSAVFRAAA